MGPAGGVSSGAADQLADDAAPGPGPGLLLLPHPGPIPASFFPPSSQALQKLKAPTVESVRYEVCKMIRMLAEVSCASELARAGGPGPGGRAQGPAEPVSC
jgi:hypothetical protein